VPRPEKDIKRDRRFTFRLTPEEEEQVRSDMAAFDYLSMSKYVRTLLLRKYIPVQKVTMTDRSIRNQINDISLKISRIGTNYNQVVKRYNQSCSEKKKNGDPVINTKATMFYIAKLYDMMREVRDLQKQIIEQVSLVQIKNETAGTSNKT
jgi:hypothetical protein